MFSSTAHTSVQQTRTHARRNRQTPTVRVWADDLIEKLAGNLFGQIYSFLLLTGRSGAFFSLVVFYFRGVRKSFCNTVKAYSRKELDLHWICIFAGIQCRLVCVFQFDKYLHWTKLNIFNWQKYWLVWHLELTQTSCSHINFVQMASSAGVQTFSTPIAPHQPHQPDQPHAHTAKRTINIIKFSLCSTHKRCCTFGARHATRICVGSRKNDVDNIIVIQCFLCTHILHAMSRALRAARAKTLSIFSSSAYSVTGQNREQAKHARKHTHTHISAGNQPAHTERAKKNHPTYAHSKPIPPACRSQTYECVCAHNTC